jgi:hypothetical protein
MSAACVKDRFIVRSSPLSVLEPRCPTEREAATVTA